MFVHNKNQYKFSNVRSSTVETSVFNDLAIKKPLHCGRLENVLIFVMYYKKI